MSDKMFIRFAWIFLIANVFSSYHLYSQTRILTLEQVTRGTFYAGAEIAAGRFIALDETYGGVTFFGVTGHSIENVHLLLDVKGFKLENRNWAASGGFGLRKLSAGGDKIYGINTFYDYRNKSNNSFNQWGLGLEVLSGNWEFHLNGYLPVGSKEHSKTPQVQTFAEDFAAIFTNTQYALRGIEATGGWRWGFFDNLSLYVAPGFYFYNNSKLGNIQGIQCVSELNWNSWVSFKLNASYDSQFRGRVQGIVALTIPFNFGSSCICETCESILLGRPVRRNDMVFLKRCCQVEKNWDDCGAHQ